MTRADMSEYHKIDTVFKRDMVTKSLLDGQYTNDVFACLAGARWTFTEKVDGTNIRVMIGDGRIAFGGKTDNAQIPAPLSARLQERFLPMQDALLAAFPEGACLYGEGYGAKIQKGGGNYRSDQDFVLFDVRVGNWWLQRPDIEDVAGKYGLDIVPILCHGTLTEMVVMAKAGIRSTWGDFQAEGIVARPQAELMTRSGRRVITKIKCRDFSQSRR